MSQSPIKSSIEMSTVLFQEIHPVWLEKWIQTRIALRNRGRRCREDEARTNLVTDKELASLYQVARLLWIFEYGLH